MSIEVLSQSALAVGSLMTFLWLWSVVRKDVSVVDPWWSMGFLIVSLIAARSCEMTAGKGLLLFLVSLWAVRLWSHLLRRGWGKGEDPRYTAFRKRFGEERYWWFSLFQVFGLQGVLILIISTPLHLALQTPLPDPLTRLDIVGGLLASVGFLFEAVGDAQLVRFKSDPANRGKVLDRGLWRYTRHPNYFGETLLWWGFWCFSLDSSWGFLSIFSPILMTYLLLKVSGVTMLESQLQETKPAYADYIAKTSTFFPWFPKS